MAESLFRLAAGRKGLDVEVRSAGVSAIDGVPISQHSASILREKGEDAAGKFSKELNSPLIEWADLILTMTMSHKKQLIQRFPAAIDKTYTLKEYAGSIDEQLVAESEQFLSELQIKKALNEPITEEDRARLISLDRQIPGFSYDIADPFGGSLTQYRQCAAEIETAVEAAINKLLSC